MPDTQNMETPAATAEHVHGSDNSHDNSSRRAAAIEAAYILEAVRK
jgi:hypothetical protein